MAKRLETFEQAAGLVGCL